MIYSLFFGSLLALSAGLNLFQFFRIKKVRRSKSIDASELLGDLCRGRGLVVVTRVAPESVLLRSARDYT